MQSNIWWFKQMMFLFYWDMFKFQSFLGQNVYNMLDNSKMIKVHFLSATCLKLK